MYVSVMATLRQRQMPWTRRVLGLFVVMWLNLALSPCAMAQGHEHTCPHCPPSHTRQHDDHDMGSRDIPCAVDPSDCSALDELNYDGRTTQIKLKDTPDDLPVALLSIRDAAINFLPATPDTRLRRRPPPGRPPPLNVLYCVYLD